MASGNEYYCSRVRVSYFNVSLFFYCVVLIVSSWWEEIGLVGSYYLGRQHRRVDDRCRLINQPEIRRTRLRLSFFSRRPVETETNTFILATTIIAVSITALIHRGVYACLRIAKVLHCRQNLDCNTTLLVEVYCTSVLTRGNFY